MKPKQTLYQKLQSCENLSDKEILQGLDEFNEAYLAIWKLGPEFRITAQACVNAATKFRDFASARGILPEDC